MADERFQNRFQRALVVGACGLMLCLSASVTAHAADDEDEDTFEQKIIKNILGGIGADVGRPGIHYRERSPLVLPPSNDLPPPDAGAAYRNPAWPKEQQQRKKVVSAPKVNRRAGPEDPGTSAALTPDELRRGAKPRSGGITDPSQSGSVEEPNVGRPSRPNELGSSSIFTLNGLFGYRPEQVPFPGEPDRTALTQPPPGYQVPSSSAPYGIGADNSPGWKIPTILDRPVGTDGR